MAGWVGRLVDPAFYERGPAFSGFLNGTLLGCAGVVPLWPGLGEAWIVLSPEGRRHRAWYRAVARILPSIAASGRFRRIQADVVREFEAGRRFVERLGFKYEFTMPKYGPNGEDFVRYVYPLENQ